QQVGIVVAAPLLRIELEQAARERLDDLLRFRQELGRRSTAFPAHASSWGVVRILANVARNSSAVKGLARNAVAPAFIARSTSGCIASVLITRIGTLACLGLWRMKRVSSMPLTSGMLTSVTTT